MSLEAYFILAFFIGIFGLGICLAVAEFFGKIYKQYHVEHDRRIRLEVENAKLKRDNRALRELYQEKSAS